VFEKLTQIFKIKELRDKIVFVILMLAIFRVTAAIPVPGVDHEALANFLQGNDVKASLTI
jgi:preprotein translocase subunit SecY